MISIIHEQQSNIQASCNLTSNNFSLSGEQHLQTTPSNIQNSHDFGDLFTPTSNPTTLISNPLKASNGGTLSRTLGNRGNLRPSCVATTNEVSSPHVDLVKKGERRTQIYKARDVAGQIVPSSRAGICGKFHLDDQIPSIRINHHHHSAGFQNVLHCDSVWACPVCSQRILHARNKEIEKACNEWNKTKRVLKKAKNGAEYLKKTKRHRKMITLTHRHKKSEDLGEMLAKMANATSRLTGDRIMKLFFARVGCANDDGSEKRFIRTLEITHGQNGWHPHNHIALFSDLSKKAMDKIKIAVIFDKKGVMRWLTDTRKKRIENKIDKGLELNLWDIIHHLTPLEFLQKYWEFLAVECGLGRPNLEHGVRFDDFEETDGGYLTKSGNIGLELTGELNKEGKNGSQTPWQLLFNAVNGCVFSSNLFAEYVKATKGKRKITWSNGFKDYIGINEVEDEAISEVEDAEDVEIIEIKPTVWEIVRKKNAQPFLLNLAEYDSLNKTQHLKKVLFDFYEIVKAERIEDEIYKQLAKDLRALQDRQLEKKQI